MYHGWYSAATAPSHELQYRDEQQYCDVSVPREGLYEYLEERHESMKAPWSVSSTAGSWALPPPLSQLRYDSPYHNEDSEQPVSILTNPFVSYFDDGPASLSWATSFIRPLAHVGLCCLASAAALEVGNYHTPWSLSERCSANLATSIGGSSELYCTCRTAVSAVTFTAAATTIYHLNSGDRYQNCCLFAGITLGIGIGLSVCEGLEEALLRVLPWGILAGLLCSMLGHKILLHTKYNRHDHLNEKTWLCQDCDRGN
jgi:hypothetical protein